MYVALESIEPLIEWSIDLYWNDLECSIDVPAVKYKQTNCNHNYRINFVEGFQIS